MDGKGQKRGGKKPPFSESKRYEFSQLRKLIRDSDGNVESVINPEWDIKALIRTKKAGTVNGVQTLSDGTTYNKAVHLAKSIKITGKAKQKAQNDAYKADSKLLKLAAKTRREEFIKSLVDTWNGLSSRQKKREGKDLTQYINTKLMEVGY